MIKVADIKHGEKKDAVDPLDLYQLSQAFESFSHRCAFIMVALDNIAFSDDVSVHNKEASYGAGYYVSDLLDELQLIQKMVDKDRKTGG